MKTCVTALLIVAVSGAVGFLVGALAGGWLS